MDAPSHLGREEASDQFAQPIEPPKQCRGALPDKSYHWNRAADLTVCAHVGQAGGPSSLDLFEGEAFELPAVNIALAHGMFETQVAESLAVRVSCGRCTRRCTSCLNSCASSSTAPASRQGGSDANGADNAGTRRE